MAIAGKVAITLSTENGGSWSADVTYDRLVAVKHNNNLYISRKTVANVEPPNDEFWFLALEGFSGDDIEDIINGTTQVGNAKTLDGHGAEYFAPLESIGYLEKKSKWNAEWTKIEQASIGLYCLTGEKANITDLPPNANVGNTTILWVLVFSYSQQNGYIAIEPETGGFWFGKTYGSDISWKNIATTADLAKYLPLTGGTVANNNYVPIVVKNNSNDGGTWLRFDYSNETLGYLGFGSKDALLFKTGGQTANHNILHTGNKPTGTYTGNGDATERRITTGGIGSVCCVHGNGYTAIVHINGAFAMSYVASGVVVLTQEQIYFNNGVLVIKTDSGAINGNGLTYTYEVL